VCVCVCVCVEYREAFSGVISLSFTIIAHSIILPGNVAGTFSFPFVSSSSSSFSSLATASCVSQNCEASAISTNCTHNFYFLTALLHALSFGFCCRCVGEADRKSLLFPTFTPCPPPAPASQHSWVGVVNYKFC